MILKMDNKGAIDLTNSWSFGGRTRHVDVRYYFLRELKEEGVIKVVWIPSEDNTADLMTKNLNRAAFKKHVGSLRGSDDVVEQSTQLTWEGCYGGSELERYRCS